MNKSLPDWRIPENLQKLIDTDDDATWNCDDWLPIKLCVMGDTQYEGRDIELTWQMEYETTGCTGYEFCDRVISAVESDDPELVELLNCGDTESAACVIWVESEEACRRLLKIVWPLATN